MGVDSNNANGTTRTLNRASEVSELLEAVRSLIIPYIKNADDVVHQRSTGKAPSPVMLDDVPPSLLAEHTRPADFAASLGFSLPDKGGGQAGMLEIVEKILRNSVNTWDQGFLDKLYSSNTPVGLISDLVLSLLNTNAHVYQVSPALTVVEKTTGKALANLFGFTGPLAGGVTCPGGSASNLTSMIVARNTLFPDSKTRGNRHRDYVVFTSAHGHYSVEKNAMICGMGSDSVWTVPVDDDGCMKTTALRERIVEAKEAGKTPFYVNSTAGTTVLGSFEAFEEISQICKEFGLWMHIDASWGGPVIFSPTHRGKMKGSHLAHSITINPHKMMNVPLTCSFLLAQDMSIVKQANRTEAGYLFHGSDDDEIWDLADLSLQCGRRADSLKLALAWIYYGTDGFASQVDHAFEMASYLFKLVKESGNFNLVSREPPPCLQVCFYHAPSGKLSESPDSNTRRTKCVVAELVVRGFMVDFAPGEKGSFFRVVVNTQTLPSTLDGLVAAIVEIGKGIDHII